jgi:glycosyltransferase involved in cell wall biosynthesis
MATVEPVRLRVLMTADTVGGVWTHALDLAAALAERGVRVDLATMGAPVHPDQRRAAALVRGLRLFEGTHRLEWMDDPWAEVDAAGQWLLALERQLRPDVVHLNGYAHGALPWRAPSLVVGHSCVVSWWHAVHGEDPPARYDAYRERVRAGLLAASRVVAPSRAMAEALVFHYGLARTPRVIHNGIPPIRRGHQRKAPFVLAAGRLWDPAKNLAALADAAAHVPWPVRVAGDAAGPDGAPVRAPGVEMLGRLPRNALAGWMDHAAIFAHPARYEPFGLAPLEAAAAGCALVLGDIPSLREVWGDAAAFVPPADADALARKLRDLIHEPARRTDLAIRARRRAATYDVDSQADAYLRLYAELMRDADAHAAAALADG